MTTDLPQQIDVAALTHAQAFETLAGSMVSLLLTDPNLPDCPIVYANQAFEATTGYSADFALGRNCRFLQGPETDPEDVARIRQAIADETDVTVDVLNYRADGSTFMNRLLLTPIRSVSGELRYFLGIQKPLSPSEEKISPNAVRHAMREVQHRVKNHLSLVVSLVRMFGRGAGAAKPQFETLSRRIESLQMLYEELSNPERRRDMDTVAFGAYLSRLVAGTQALDGRGGIRMNTNLDAIDIPTDQAVSIGLIVSEVLTNALQHAFKGRESGLIEVRLQRLENDGLRIIVSDDGIGMKEDTVWPSKKSVGGMVIQSLITQMRGKVDVGRSSSGTIITLEFPDISNLT
ncbi:MAG: hypothetical protein CML03_07350 [Pseudooceanicola sp.]|nr:hypothetical protein [Pseudooceanicola sp.]|tara:strand:- start:31539 stop:32579 length:1041 start_codon:yes stop_codon:yes gene_type:complete